jgi:ribosome modulation factor
MRDKLELAYDRGYRAFFANININKNPYEDSSSEAQEWANGWGDAAEEQFHDEEDYYEREPDYGY